MAPKKTTKKKTATAATKTSFVFADQQPSPDNFTSFSKADLAADTAIKAHQVIEQIPPPRVNPPVMSLSDVLPSGTLNAYSDRITFHCVGDTGGIKTPSHQFLVAQKMVEDFADPDPSARPAFFYHLGDVVYYFGQAKYYYDQFYDPYRDYPAPIFAIPGNHDAVVYKAETGNSSGRVSRAILRARSGAHGRGRGNCAHRDDPARRLFHAERTVRENYRPLFQYFGRNY